MHSSIRWVLFSLVAGVLAPSAQGLRAQDECSDDRIEPPGTEVAGKSIGEWTAEWWRWVVSIPTERNPLLDPDGSRCAIEQSEPVFLLPGGPPGGTAPVMRGRCVVPCGKPILVALVNALFWAPGDCHPDNMEACRVPAAQIIDTVDRLALTVDGVPVLCLEDHREVSPVFDFTLPVNNIFNLGDPLTRKGVSDGFWVMLRPLPPGKHTIVVEAHVPGFEIPLVTNEITVAPCAEVTFRRGDVDGNEILDITDAVVVLERLFLGRETLLCDDSADTNDDGELKLTDPIYTLNHLFQGGPAPSSPGAEACGADPTGTDALRCERGC